MIRCEKCGSFNEDNQNYCGHCGNKLNDNRNQQQPPSQNNPHYYQNTYYTPPSQQQYEYDYYSTQIERNKTGKGCLISALVVVGILVLIFLFASWEASDNSDNNDTHSKLITSQSTTESNEKKAEKGLYVLDNSELKYVSSKIVSEDYGDSHYLIVNYEYKNTSEENIAFYYDVTTQAFQNGIELQSPISTYGIHDFDFHNTEKEIKPGATIEIHEAFEISNYDDEVTIEIYDNLSSDKADYSFEINPKNSKTN